MIILQDEDKKRIRNIQIELIQEIDRVCRKNNINYYLAYGTLLGAIRHKGYIPWDDDADIMLLREDYNKLKEACKTDLKDKFFFQDAETDENYLWGYGKLKNINTKAVRCGQEHIKCKSGLAIDIFPLDNIPNTLIGQIVQNIICIICRKALWARVGKYSEKKFLKKVGLSILSLIPKKIIYRIVNKIISINKDKNKNAVRCLLFRAPGVNGKQPLRKRYGYNREWFAEKIEVDFEGYRFYTIKGYDEYLKYIYRDYMKLPPKTQQVGQIDYSILDLKREGL